MAAPPGHDPRYDIDSQAAQRAFSRAARGYDAHAVLQREVARRMAERLQYIRLAPERVLDVGCGTGADLRLLAERYPAAQRIGVDFALPMLKEARGELPWFRRLLPGGRARDAQLLCADATRLPLRDESVALVWSNMMLQWLPDPLPALTEMRRLLRTDGLLMFATLGPDTLKELRRAFATVGEAPHVHRFTDMHDLGDMLTACGFAEPVMDTETLTLTYRTTDELLRDLRASGASCAAVGRPRGMMGKGAWQRVRTAYEMHRRDERLPATFEVVYGHAWKPAPRHTAEGHAVVHFDPRRRGRP